MSAFHNNMLLGSAKTADLGDPIEQSLRFRGGGTSPTSNTYLSCATITANSTFTLSVWLKLDVNELYSGYMGDYSSSSHFILSGAGNVANCLDIRIVNQNLTTGTVFVSDPSAWYHFVINSDATTNSSKVYLNGVDITTGSPTANSLWSGSNTCYIGNIGPGGGDYTFRGYAAEQYYIDGTALPVTDFGRFNADGVWVPKTPTISSYGSNGFHLTFDSSQNPHGIGQDSSGQGNHFTANGFDTTAISNTNWDNDIDYNDTPTNNYATLNSVLARSSALNFQNANLKTNYGGSGARCAMAGFGMPGSSGKWYWEVTLKDQLEGTVGIVSEDFDLDGDVPQGGALPAEYASTPNGWAWWVSAGTRENNNVEVQNSHTTFAVDNTIGFLLDTDNGTCTIEINGVAQTANNGAEFTNIPTDKTIFPYYTHGGGGGNVNLFWNFGQMPFVYAPTGYQSLATNNLTEPTIKDGSEHFRAITDTGANILTAAQAAFSTGLWWIKDRDNTNQHQLVDSIRGTATARQTPGGLIANYAAPLGNSIAYCWNAPDEFNDTDSDINSTGRRNVDAGFSIRKYTGNGITGAQGVAHGLGKTPEFIFVVKEKTTASNSAVYHKDVTTASPSSNSILVLETTATVTNYSTAWAQAHNATNFYVGNITITNTNNDAFTAYVWTSVPGYSAFGSYTGNSNLDNAFVYTGFKPAFVLIKSTAAAADWQIYDTTRNPNNPSEDFLSPNNQLAETTGFDIDILSNGFKLRSANGPNATSSDCIYAAFAEHPFGGENTAPATAR